jgi:hypothetical protein
VDQVVKTVEAVSSSRKKRTKNKKPSQDIDWRDYKVEAIKSGGNPFKKNSLRWQRQKILTQQRSSIRIIDYGDLCQDSGLRTVSKKFIRESIAKGCIKILEKNGRALTRNGLSKFNNRLQPN